MLSLAVKSDCSSLVWFVCLSGLFCLSLIRRLYGVGNCWHRLSGVRSKLVNKLSRVSRCVFHSSNLATLFYYLFYSTVCFY